MRKKLYIVYDILAKETASAIIISDNDETLCRDLKGAKLPDVMEDNPNDFDVLCIGELDTENGCIVSVDKSIVVHLGVLKDGKK